MPDAPGSVAGERSGTRSLCLHFAPKRTIVHVVDEGALAADLDHRQPLAVPRLELGIAGDIDLLQLERAIRPCRGDDRARPLAQVAALRVVDRDLRPGYGYKPRVTVASATRCTASP